MMDTEEILKITEDPETLWTRFAPAILESFSSKDRLAEANGEASV